jgi:hypothetical protein
MRIALVASFLGVVELGLSGCVVEERTVARPVAPCRQAVWVAGGYGAHGHHHPGHWRCGYPHRHRIVVVE